MANSTIFKIRRDTAANWSSENPTLSDGEMGLDKTNNFIKMGDGTTAWNSLAQFTQNIENVEDLVGAMVTSNTETFVTVTYQDADGTLDFVVPVHDEDNLASNSATHLATQQSIKAYVDGQTHITLLDEDNMASDSATQAATQQSVKAYVDAQVTAQDLDFIADSGGSLSIDLDSEALTIAGGTGLDSVGSGNGVTLNIDATVATLTGSQTLTNKTLTSPVLNTGVSGTAVKDEDNMASNSATHVATQQSIKAYVDAQVDTADALSELADTTITAAADGSLLLYDTGNSVWIDNVMSGDATLVDTGAITLATVNSNVGSFGSTSAIPVITVNAKGLITAASTASITTSLTVGADSGSDDAVALASDTLDFSGGTGIDTTVSNNDISIAIDGTVTTLTGSQTLTNKTLTAPALTDPTITGTSSSLLDPVLMITTSDEVHAHPQIELGNNNDEIVSISAHRTDIGTWDKYSMNLFFDPSGSQLQTGVTAGQEYIQFSKRYVNLTGGDNDNGTDKTDMNMWVTGGEGGFSISSYGRNSAGTLAERPIYLHGDSLVYFYDGSNVLNLNQNGFSTGGSAFKDQDDMSSNSATSVASQQSIKAYVDAQVTAQDLDMAADSGTAAIDLDSETLTVSGTANQITTALSGNTLTVSMPDNVTIAGNLTVAGTQTTLSSTTINVADPLLFMATGNNAADAVDIGLYGLYDTSGSQDLYGGLFRDASDSGKWKLFKDNQAVPTTTVNTSGTGYAVGTLVANLEGNVTTAAQTAITSLGTLTALNVDNINVNGNTISSTAGTDLLITPLAGQQIVLDGAIVIDAGVVTGATSITSTAFVGDITGTVTGASSLNLLKTGGAMTGAITTNSTFDGRDVAADGVTADAALPKAGGAMTGAITTNSTFDGRDVAADGVTADAALPKAGGAMTGAITTNSTFDGRDVATDGTKLDGIEAAADVTDATNVNAAGALMLSDTTTAGLGIVIDEDNMASNSATKVPTQQSVKAYVDVQTTDETGEGSTNLYFTNERVDDRVNALIIGGTNVTATYDDGANTLTISAAEGASGYNLNSNDTDDLSEGSSNLYYTNARADARITNALKDEDNMASDSATHVPSQQSVEAYVDAQVTAQDFDFDGDSGGELSIDLDSEKLTFTGGTGITTVGSGNSMTFAIDATVATLTGSQTLTNKTLTAATLSGTHTAAADFKLSGTPTDLDDPVLDIHSTTTGWNKPHIRMSDSGNNVMLWNSEYNSGQTAYKSIIQLDPDNDNSESFNHTAGSFQVGLRYKITASGNTDFTAIGAADNNVNTLFLATGAGSGTGTALSAAYAGDYGYYFLKTYNDVADPAVGVQMKQDIWGSGLGGAQLQVRGNYTNQYAYVPFEINSGGLRLKDNTSAGYIYFPEDEGNGTHETTLIGASSQAASTVLTLPSATDTLVGKATTDTLTNKTLTSPVINGTISGTGLDAYLSGGTGVTYSSGAFSIGQAVATDSDVTFDDVVVSGNLTVNGTTTTVGTTNMVVSDKLIELANGQSGTPSGDIGLVFERGSSNNAFIGWDESADKFTVGTGSFTGASTGNLSITTGTIVANIEGDVTGTITGAASLNLLKTGGAMTGAITTNSTFDGRDVAADGVTADAALPKAGGAMTGAITTNSTFDGRDVATDGTKLDAIEASADVTDATNVAAAGAVMESGDTASAKIPSGTTAQRDGSPSAGYFRWNTTTTAAEIYDGSDWALVGGGNTTGKALWEHSYTVAENYEMTSGNNALTAGPITINSGSSVTVPSGSTWIIV